MIYNYSSVNYLHSAPPSSTINI